MTGHAATDHAAGAARVDRVEPEVAEVRGRERHVRRRACRKARKVLGWPKRCKLAHACLLENSYKGLKLLQLLGQLGVFLTNASPHAPARLAHPACADDGGSIGAARRDGPEVDVQQGVVSTPRSTSPTNGGTPRSATRPTPPKMKNPGSAAQVRPGISRPKTGSCPAASPRPPRAARSARSSTDWLSAHMAWCARAAGQAGPRAAGIPARPAAYSAGSTSADMPWPSEKGVSWPKICKLAHAFLWGYSYKRLKLAQLLGQLGTFLTLVAADEMTRR
jgi:hypothetical protein